MVASRSSTGRFENNECIVKLIDLQSAAKGDSADTLVLGPVETLVSFPRWINSSGGPEEKITISTASSGTTMALIGDLVKTRQSPADRART